MITLLAIWTFIKAWWKPLAIGLAVLLVMIFVYRACNRPAKIDIKNIEKINSVNEAERLKELEKVIVENQDVIKTVDERNTIAETSEAERQAQIHAKIKEADAKILAARREGRDVTGPELECLLTGVCE